MATAILSTRMLVSKPLVEDLIVEAAPRLEWANSHSFQRIYPALQASVDRVAAACRDMDGLPHVVAEERQRMAKTGPICAKAFELFIKNLCFENEASEVCSGLMSPDTSIGG
jgi:hypothetical protein